MILKRETLLALLITLLIMPINPSLATGIQKWIDENGNVHYGERSPENNNAMQVENKINIVKQSSLARDIAIIYTTSSCGYCKKAKAFLNHNNIPFREANIEKSLSDKRRYDQLGGRAVPLLVKGKKILQGFNSSRYTKFFDL